MNNLVHLNGKVSRRGAKQASHGFTLIEVLISMTIALFLLGGLLTVVQSTKNAFATQNQLASLQDNQRLAMTFMAEVVESAGYYPDPIIPANTAASFFPVDTPKGFTTAGQVFYGTSGGAKLDSITVRFGVKPSDIGLFGCNGKGNTTAANDTLVSKFSVVTVNGIKQLICTFSNNTTPATDVTLVNGVRSLTVLYGVTRNAGPSLGSCADTYLTTALMLSADWLKVCSVHLRLEFDNPLDTANPITINRLVAAMQTAGVN